MAEEDPNRQVAEETIKTLIDSAVGSVFTHAPVDEIGDYKKLREDINNQIYSKLGSYIDDIIREEPKENRNRERLKKIYNSALANVAVLFHEEYPTEEDLSELIQFWSSFEKIHVLSAGVIKLMSESLEKDLDDKVRDKIQEKYPNEEQLNDAWKKFIGQRQGDIVNFYRAARLTEIFGYKTQSKIYTGKFTEYLEDTVRSI